MILFDLPQRRPWLRGLVPRQHRVRGSGRCRRSCLPGVRQRRGVEGPDGASGELAAEDRRRAGRRGDADVAPGAGPHRRTSITSARALPRRRARSTTAKRKSAVSMARPPRPRPRSCATRASRSARFPGCRATTPEQASARVAGLACGQHVRNIEKQLCDQNRGAGAIDTCSRRAIRCDRQRCEGPVAGDVRASVMPPV